jgi:2-oxoglutarate dehydrogenase E1 component
VRRWRKPLVVITPKSLLRHARCVSTLDELATGRFQAVIGAPRLAPSRKTSRVLLCCGKMYYELLESREESGRIDVELVRIEEFSPLPTAALAAALAPFPDGTPVYWVQEEPENMGAWRYLRVKLGETLFDRFPFAGIARDASASPATGSPGSHQIEQAELLARAFGLG